MLRVPGRQLYFARLGHGKSSDHVQIWRELASHFGFAHTVEILTAF